MLAWQERWPEIGDVRGLGSMLAIELVSDRGYASRRRSSPAVVDAALARGLLLLTCGVYGNCIRVLVPLVITDAELDEALGVWEDALEVVLG
jgi:4-aminobutyrate aminotransferase-like enzyme